MILRTDEICYGPKLFGRIVPPLWISTSDNRTTPSPNAVRDILRFQRFLLHLMTDHLRVTEDEKIVDLLEPMNSDSNAEIDNETPSKTVTFSNVVHC
ncbi:hypothetical protein TNCV_1989451 [Trichonephila clavipes]|nr:hypothetical protein TNCV_1989451 [Trichonephila clavipes]